MVASACGEDLGQASEAPMDRRPANKQSMCMHWGQAQKVLASNRAIALCLAAGHLHI